MKRRRVTAGGVVGGMLAVAHTVRNLIKTRIKWEWAKAKKKKNPQVKEKHGRGSPV